MLTLYELKFHCRTCLRNLSPCATGNDSIEFIVFSQYTEVKELIQVCLRNASGGAEGEADAEDVLNENMPNMCITCFRKWLDFAKFHFQVLKENNEELKRILKKGQLDKINSDHFEHSNNKPDHESIWEIENCNTSPFYQVDLRETQVVPKECETSAETIKQISTLTIPENGNNGTNNTVSPNTVSDTGANALQMKCKLSKTEKMISSLSVEKIDEIKNINIKRVRYRCDPCKKYFFGLHKYEGHIKQIHEGLKKAYQCKYCSKSYRFYKNLNDHVTLNHASVDPSQLPVEKQTFQCDECNGVFKTKDTLKTHQRLKHQAPSKSCICEQCGFICHNPYGLEKHIKNKHSVAEKIKCPQCSKTFKNPYYLKYHILNVHNTAKVKPFKCTTCSMEFSRLALLNVHKRSHLKPSERIKCDYQGCDVRFLFNGEKVRHMRLVHLKVKKHICDICGEAFGTAPTLRHHRYIHTGEKPFICTICGQGFRQRSAMRTHQKTHKPPKVDISVEIMNDDITDRYILNLENFLK
uniref:C2H2-type domain-containing protein n=1 Tax=Stomoxys calcitrans TaxID=35570 RepID=A0A1I8NYJ7_STOCA